MGNTSWAVPFQGMCAGWRESSSEKRTTRGVRNGDPLEQTPSCGCARRGCGRGGRFEGGLVKRCAGQTWWGETARSEVNGIQPHDNRVDTCLVHTFRLLSRFSVVDTQICTCNKMARLLCRRVLGIVFHAFLECRVLFSYKRGRPYYQRRTRRLSFDLRIPSTGQT